MVLALLVVGGGLVSTSVKALILTGSPAVGVCQTMSDFPSISSKMDKEEIRELISYKMGCWEFLVKNAPQNLLRPGPYQYLNQNQRKIVRELEEQFKNQWNATHLKKIN